MANGQVHSMAATMLIPLKQHTYAIEYVYTSILDYIAKNDRRIFRLSSLGVSMSRSSEADLSRLIGVALQQRARYI